MNNKQIQDHTMNKLLLVSLLIVVASAANTAGKKPHPAATTKAQRQGGDQTCTLYDGYSQTGAGLNFNNYEPDLSIYGFNDVASSATINGVWMFYGDDNYNSFGDSAAFYAAGQSYSLDMDPVVDNGVSSIKYAGAPDGFLYDCLTFYSSEFFQGSEQYFYDSTPSLASDNAARSMILNGCSDWTVYDGVGYTGSAVCFRAASDCFPQFYPFEQNMNGLANTVSSARNGCFSKTVVEGKRMPNFFTKQDLIDAYSNEV